MSTHSIREKNLHNFKVKWNLLWFYFVVCLLHNMMEPIAWRTLIACKNSAMHFKMLQFRSRAECTVQLQSYNIHKMPLTFSTTITECRLQNSYGHNDNCCLKNFSNTCYELKSKVPLFLSFLFCSHAPQHVCIDCTQSVLFHF